MNPVLIVFATREGQTRRIAEHVAADLRARDLVAEVFDVAHLLHPIAVRSYSAVVVAAPLHLGRHAPEMVRFVKEHRAELDGMPTSFLSVSLTEAGVEDRTGDPEARERARAEVRASVQAFFVETGWHPGRTRPVAGALAYTQYGTLKRFVMKMIAKHAGAPTDTSQDYELTDWLAIDHFVDELVGAMKPDPTSASAVA